jgi:hypothetical protein
MVGGVAWSGPYHDISSMSEPTQTASERAAIRRQTLTGRRVPLGQEDAAELEEIPIAQRLAAVCVVSRSAWALAGTPIEPLRRDLVTRIRRVP